MLAVCRLMVPPSYGEVVYEGERELCFELCRARQFRHSVVLATGKLSLATVFSAAGVGGSHASFTVPLFDEEDGHPSAWLVASICCEAGDLSDFGGVAALRTLGLPKRPTPYAPIVSGKRGHRRVVSGDEVSAYCRTCIAHKQALQEAYGLACAAANTPQELVPNLHAADEAAEASAE